MHTFAPRFEILPAAQRNLWPRLAPSVASGFVLYGGTAIALRLGHRPSVDFDFFSAASFDPQSLARTFDFVADATVLQEQPDTYTILVRGDDGIDTAGVKVSFFGALTIGRVGTPNLTDDNVLCVASLDDLMATKLKVVLQRVESRDYVDIVALLNAGVPLDRGLAAAKALYGQNFQPSECLKALTYFKGGDLNSLSDDQRRVLVRQVRQVTELPEVRVVSSTLSWMADN